VDEFGECFLGGRVGVEDDDPVADGFHGLGVERWIWRWRRFGEESFRVEQGWQVVGPNNSRRSKSNAIIIIF